jgi:Na+/phosphate symporter
MANLTQADFESVTDNLNAASEALQDNDTTEAYDTVNSVESELFDIANDQGEQNTKTLMQIFKPLQDNIDSTRDALRNNDTANALQLLNSTDAELLKITPQLPAEEGQEEEAEEE